MAVGELTEQFSDSFDYEPIVTYPLFDGVLAFDKCERGGFVLEFTIDEEGRVRDPAITESHWRCEGGFGKFLEASAIASVRRYRYIPRFENGVPVSVPDMRIETSWEF